MRASRTLWVVAVVLLMLAAIVSCGDGDGESGGRDSNDESVPSDDERNGDEEPADERDDDPLTRALADEIQSSFTDQGIGDELPTDEASCAANSIVAEIGPARLEELGVTPDAAALEALIRDQDNTAERDAIAAALSDCVDLVRTLSAVYGAIGLSETSSTCVAEGIVADPDLRKTLLLGDEPVGETVGRFDALAASCFTPEEQEMFGPNAGSTPPSTTG